MNKIEERLHPDQTLGGEEEMAKIWTYHSPAPVVHKTYAEAMGAIASPSEVYEKSLAEQWRETGCATEGTPYVLRTLLRRLDPDISPFASISPEKAKLAAAFLAPDCAGARGLSEAEIAKVKAIRDTPHHPRRSRDAKLNVRRDHATKVGICDSKTIAGNRNAPFIARRRALRAKR